MGISKLNSYVLRGTLPFPEPKTVWVDENKGTLA